ncbi:MAG: stage IV sporulation protein A [Oscillospiraceae bacterium]|nr:stage IV sporulation protein A [Oscillospiraceae bacterium]
MDTSIYQDIATRTAGDIYIGVVGPVRTGKSTFIKRFMETMVLPNIEDPYRRDRARDELPQSGSGRMIMTAEPKFVPEEAVELSLAEGGTCSVRLIDCVGYMVPGAVGSFEGEMERMVMTPWYPQEVTMSQAAETGTRKVIAEHSTIGIVMTTDGSITDIPREDYEEAEAQVVQELQTLGKPFLIVLNCAQPDSDDAQALRQVLASRYGVTCIAVNCLSVGEEEIRDIIRGVLGEFPLMELDVWLPSWLDALPVTHPIRSGIYDMLRKQGDSLRRICDVQPVAERMDGEEKIERAEVSWLELGTGVAAISLDLPRELFYRTVGEECGFSVADDGDLMQLLTELGGMKQEYDKVAKALADVRETGYGIVPPSVQDLRLEEPEIMRQGGRYGVRLKASAPSIHMLRADIETEVAPIVGTEKQSEELIESLLRDFEDDTRAIWQSNLFGRSFHDLVGEDLQGKLRRMPEDAREKLRTTLQRIINESAGGLICILL